MLQRENIDNCANVLKYVNETRVCLHTYACKCTSII